MSFRIEGSQYEPGCVAITGGTGSFGQAFTRHLLAHTDAKIRIISRDEAKQDDMQRALPDARLTFILGDVRDRDKLAGAFHGADSVLHAAALKRVPFGQVNPDEFVKTNTNGTENAIEAALRAGVARFIFISSDKAVQPVNYYGVSKALAEGLVFQANQRGVTRGARFSVVRGGNVWGSRGNVVEQWLAASAPIVTASSATRFHLPMSSWCAFVLRVLCEMHGGEVFVPKLRAWSVGDLAQAFDGMRGAAMGFGSSGSPIGLRSGDKQHETLIGQHEANRVIDIGWAYVIEPSDELREVWAYRPWYGTPAPDGFAYSSDRVERVPISELRALLEGV